MHTVKPARNQLFCKPDSAETKTVSGFLLSERAVDKPRTAEVINIGVGVTDFSAKDRIIYKTYSTTEVKLNNEEFFLVSADDVLGTIHETE